MELLRTPVVIRILLVPAAVAALIAGCGQAPAPGSGSSQVGGRPSQSALPAPATFLDVTVTGLPGGKTSHWTLTCDPVGGTIADPAATCASMGKFADPFAPPPKGTMCPAIVVGPAKATIFGNYRRHPVRLTLTESGCDLVIWDRISKLLGGKPPA